MTEREWKSGDRVMVTITVPATLNAVTNQGAPTGNWWVQIDGRPGLTAFHESEFMATLGERAREE